MRRERRRSVPKVAYERTAAWLLGLEGVALLRALAGDRDYDKAFVDTRLAEMRDILVALDEPPFSRETWTGEVDTRQGYEWWAPTYDEPGNPLIAIEEPVVRALLEQLPRGRRIRRYSRAGGPPSRASQDAEAGQVSRSWKSSRRSRVAIACCMAGRCPVMCCRAVVASSS